MMKNVNILMCSCALLMSLYCSGVDGANNGVNGANNGVTTPAVNSLETPQATEYQASFARYIPPFGNSLEKTRENWFKIAKDPENKGLGTADWGSRYVNLYCRGHAEQDDEQKLSSVPETLRRRIALSRKYFEAHGQRLQYQRLKNITLTDEEKKEIGEFTKEAARAYIESVSAWRNLVNDVDTELKDMAEIPTQDTQFQGPLDKIDAVYANNEKIKIEEKITNLESFGRSLEELGRVVVDKYNLYDALRTYATADVQENVSAEHVHMPQIN